LWQIGEVFGASCEPLVYWQRCLEPLFNFYLPFLFVQQTLLVVSCGELVFFYEAGELGALPRLGSERLVAFSKQMSRVDFPPGFVVSCGLFKAILLRLLSYIGQTGRS